MGGKHAGLTQVSSSCVVGSWWWQWEKKDRGRGGVLWAVWGWKVGAVWEGEGQHGQGGGH